MTTMTEQIDRILHDLGDIADRIGLTRVLDDFDYIIGRIGRWWRRAWTPWVILLIVIGDHLVSSGQILLPLLIGWAVIYLIAYTWPRRWLLDIVAAILLWTATVHFALMHSETLRRLVGV